MYIGLIVSGVISVLLLALGIYVYSAQPNRPEILRFLILVLSIVSWIITNTLADVLHPDSLAILSTKLAYVSALLIGWSLFNFVQFFPKVNSKYGLLAKILFFLPIGVAIFLSFGDGVVSGIGHYQGGIDVKVGPLFDVFLVPFLIYMVASVTVLFIRLRSSSGIIRQQTVYLLLGFFVSFIFGTIFNVALPALSGLWQFSKIGPAGTLFLLGFTAYSIIAHRLFDIRVIIRRTVIFAGLSVFILGTYALVIFVGAGIVGGRGVDAFAAATLIPNFVAALGIAFGFEPLRKWLTTHTDRWLFKGEYTPQEVSRELSETLTNVVNLAEAVQQMMETVVNAMRLSKSVAFLVQPGEKVGDYELKQTVTVGFKPNQQLQLLPQDPLVMFFEHRDQKETGNRLHNVVVTEELMRQLDEGNLPHERAQITADFVTRVDHLDGAVALPLFIKRQQAVQTDPGTPTQTKEVETFIGVLILGEKKSGDAFTDQDLNLLNLVASQTAAAVEKSRLFEEDQLKTEFVAVASHELLTPTAAMEGYLSMILDEGMGKVDKQARGYLETVYAESKRLASLVKDILNVSRIERGKIVVVTKPMDIATAIDNVLKGLVFKAKERNITVVFDAPKQAMPQVMGDPEKLTEVLVNLVGNSIKYTQEGGHADITLEQKNGFVLVHVADNGIGMKPEDMEHLFQKFFRASNSDATAQTGTGLGLYITKSVIELMGGTIGVESVLGKGSTFTFSLPIATEADAVKAAQYEKDKAAAAGLPAKPADQAPAPVTESKSSIEPTTPSDSGTQTLKEQRKVIDKQSKA